MPFILIYKIGFKQKITKKIDYFTKTRVIKVILINYKVTDFDVL